MKTVSFHCIVLVLLTVGSSVRGQGETEQDQIQGFRPNKQTESPTLLEFTVNYHRTAKTGRPVVLHAYVVDAEGKQLPTQSRRQRTELGRGTATLSIRYAGKGKPSKSTHIVVVMASMSNHNKPEPIARARFEYAKTWGRSAPGPSARTGQRGRGRDKMLPGKPSEAGKSGKGGKAAAGAGLPKDQASPELLKAAEKGEFVQFDGEGNIVLVPFNVRNITLRSDDSAVARVTVDYNCLPEEEGAEILLRASALRGEERIQSIQAPPKPIDRGVSSARLLLRLRGEKPVESDSIRVAMIRKGNTKPFYRKVFPVRHQWQPAPKKKPEERQRGSSLQFVSFKKTSEYEGELSVEYECGFTVGEAEFEAALFVGGEKQTDFEITWPEPKTRPNIRTAKIKWKGSSPTTDPSDTRLVYLHSPEAIGSRLKATDKLVVQLIRKTPRAALVVAQLRLPGEITWKNPNVLRQDEMRWEKGTIQSINAVDGVCTIKTDHNVDFLLRWAAAPDVKGLRVGQRIEVIGETGVVDRRNRLYELRGCREVGKPITAAGYVAAVKQGETIVHIQEQGNPIVLACEFPNPSVPNAMKLADLVEIHGEAIAGQPRHLVNCTLEFRYSPKPESLIPFDVDSASITEAAGWDMLLEVRSSVLQDFIDAAYEKNKSAFSGSLVQIHCPKLSFWSMGGQKPCLQITADYPGGTLALDLPIKFRETNDREDTFVIDVENATALNVRDAATGGMLSMTAEGVARAVNETTERVTKLKTIPIPIRVLGDLFRGYHVMLKDYSSGDDYKLIEQHLNRVVWGFHTHAIRHDGIGSLFVGLGFQTETNPKPVFGSGFTTWDKSMLARNDDIGFAVAGWLVVGRIRYIMKPIKVVDVSGMGLKGMIPKVKDHIVLVIIDEFVIEYSNRVFHLKEVWVDLYRIESGIDPLFSVDPTKKNPRKRGDRRNTDGLRLTWWTAKPYVEKDSKGIPRIKIQFGEGDFEFRGFMDFIDDFLSFLDAIFITPFDHWEGFEMSLSTNLSKFFGSGIFEVAPAQFPIYEIDKTFAIGKLTLGEKDIVVRATLMDGIHDVK